MSTHLITGYAGREHITSADQGSFNAALFGTGEYALARGEQFRCQVISNNKVRIFDGDALMQGRHIMIDRNTYEETTHDNGTQGYKRIDLIVFTYTKNASSGIESVSLDVIKGTPSASNPVVPSYITGDIVDEGELKNQMPLYQIPFDGLSIGTPVKMFETISTLEAMKQGMETEISEAVSNMEETIDEAVANMGGTVLDDVDDIDSCNQSGFVAGALALKETRQDVSELNSNLDTLSSDLGGFTPVIDSTGKITGYKTEAGGADTVFPFSSMLEEVRVTFGSHCSLYRPSDNYFRAADNWEGEYMKFNYADATGYTIKALKKGKFKILMAAASPYISTETIVEKEVGETICAIKSTSGIVIAL